MNLGQIDGSITSRPDPSTPASTPTLRVCDFFGALFCWQGAIRAAMNNKDGEVGRTVKAEAEAAGRLRQAYRAQARTAKQSPQEPGAPGDPVRGGAAVVGTLGQARFVLALNGRGGQAAGGAC